MANQPKPGLITLGPLAVLGWHGWDLAKAGCLSGWLETSKESNTIELKNVTTDNDIVDRE